MNVQKQKSSLTITLPGQPPAERISTIITGLILMLVIAVFLLIILGQIVSNCQKVTDTMQQNTETAQQLISENANLKQANDDLAQANQQLMIKNDKLIATNEALATNIADVVAALQEKAHSDSWLDPVLFEGLNSEAVTQLDRGTTCYISIQLPSHFLRRTALTNNASRSTQAKNDTVATVFYPETVSAGETGQFIILLRANSFSELLAGQIAFTANDELHLINGSSTPAYAFNSGDLALTDEGTLNMRFYTSATNEFKHPASSSIVDPAGTIRCNYVAY